MKYNICYKNKNTEHDFFHKVIKSGSLLPLCEKYLPVTQFIDWKIILFCRV